MANEVAVRADRLAARLLARFLVLVQGGCRTRRPRPVPRRRRHGGPWPERPGARGGLADPFDPQRFATEPSALSGMSLADVAELLISQVKQVGGGRPCVLVAHSMGGVAATTAAQLAPELFAHLVYLTAYMPASGVPVMTYAQAPEHAGGLLSAAIRADPAVVGAVRIHPGSADRSTTRLLRQAFYHDVDPQVTDAAIAMLSCDAPLGLITDSTELTTRGWDRYHGPTFAVSSTMPSR